MQESNHIHKRLVPRIHIMNSYNSVTKTTQLKNEQRVGIRNSPKKKCKRPKSTGREMQIKTIMRHHVTRTMSNVINFKKKETQVLVSTWREKAEPSSTSGGNGK